MNNRTLLSIAVTALLGAALLASGAARAANATTNLSVTATVANNCTIATTAVAFGAYDPIVANASTALTGSGTVTISCTKGTAPTITLGLGSNASGSTRQMANGTERLAYELYQPSSTTAGAACGPLSQVWGTTGAAIFSPTAAPSRTARTYNVCGSVPAAQDVAAGSYADTVVATVNF